MKKIIFYSLFLLLGSRLAAAPGLPMGVLIACKSTDAALNPVGITTKIKAGTCVSLLFKAKQKQKSTGKSLMWSFYKVAGNGQETFVKNQVQGVGQNPTWSKLTDDFCDVFMEPGTYHIYFGTQDSYEAHNGGNNAEAYAVTTLLVQ